MTTKMKSWYVYIIRCENNSLYTGITTDIKRRWNEHKHLKAGAKFFRINKPIKIEFIALVNNRSEASKLELDIKKMNKVKKEELILSNKNQLAVIKY